MSEVSVIPSEVSDHSRPAFRALKVWGRNKRTEVTNFTMIGPVIEVGGCAAYVADDREAALFVAAPDTYTALQAMTDWVRAALNCKSWVWDGDQRECAEIELAAAMAALAKAEGRS